MPINGNYVTSIYKLSHQNTKKIIVHIKHYLWQTITSFGTFLYHLQCCTQWVWKMRFKKFDICGVISVKDTTISVLLLETDRIPHGIRENPDRDNSARFCTASPTPPPQPFNQFPQPIAKKLQQSAMIRKMQSSHTHSCHSLENIDSWHRSSNPIFSLSFWSISEPISIFRNFFTPRSHWYIVKKWYEATCLHLKSKRVHIISLCIHPSEYVSARGEGTGAKSGGGEESEVDRWDNFIPDERSEYRRLHLN